MEDRKALLKPQRTVLLRTGPKPKIDSDPHPADQHVGRQIATVRVQSDVSQAQLARSIGISFQQLQKYENARNRVSASMLYEIAKSLGVPVGRFFAGLPGNDETCVEAPPLPVDERLDFIASAEGRRLIEGLVNLSPRVRGRVSSLIAALGEELASLDAKRDNETAGESAPAECKTG
ncbi:XRE family transcriptional regulator [Mesorhizobium sp. M7A.T.Ca.TU.009.01.3.2]|nr:XRE family transcriptional regulator [Mesorhizobium sp. M7A.T.Ca.TU.009.01.3.2]RUU81213.1 XRE family transcriptional regulator [Mesorhizobium sp. M7A.F.Ca.MR.362.00.0.0]RUV06313.1 XRE family transcriptional regulator [Mesorhizobium sp. M7A.T.Ca.TU.009.01.3.1]RWN96395.1 MAG: XRE family transcriptional regulator [Mesorhizobium sp.]